MGNTKQFFRALGIFSSIVGLAALVFASIGAIIYGVSYIPQKIGAAIAFTMFILVMAGGALLIGKGLLELWKFAWDEAFRIGYERDRQRNM